MIVRSDESLNMDTAVAALALAEAVDFYYTQPREKSLPPLILESLREYRRRRRRVPLDPRQQREESR